MPDVPIVRIFISSPSDVRPERVLAERIIARLAREFAYHLRVEAVMWEREPLVASMHFQDVRNIPPPSRADVVVVILWSRLGVVLPQAEFRGAISGRPVTGTEWEFEDALFSARQQHGVPYLLLYRKRQSVTTTLDDDKSLENQREQKRLVEDFMGRWFGDATSNDIRAASHSFLTTLEFEELLYLHLRAILEKRAGSQTQSAAIHWHEAPFRGLLSFEVEHAPVFFGRGRARNELREVLTRRVAAGKAFVLVFGASGSGKSSLVKAGLLPDLMLPGMVGQVALCRFAIMRPSDSQGDIFRALAFALMSPSALPDLVNLQYTVERMAALLREAPGQATLPIEQGLERLATDGRLSKDAEARLILVCDQLEELFTSGNSDTDIAAFVLALDTLASSGLVWVVATMRSDFFGRLESYPALAALAPAEARYLVLPPDDAELAAAIVEPAREAGGRFEVDPLTGIDLHEVIRQDAAEDRGALPLLSFVLDELWRERDRRGMLTFAAYRSFGGLKGALARRATEIFQSLPEAAQNTLPQVLRSLVTTTPGGDQVTARAASLLRFAPGSQERMLIDAFVNARLFVAFGDDKNSAGPTIRVAHEALLTHWDLAVQHIAEDRDDIKTRSELESATRRWMATPEQDRDSWLLRPGLPLSEAEDLLQRRSGDIGPVEKEFIEQSRLARDRDEAKREKQRQTASRRLQILGIAMVGIALIAVCSQMFAQLFQPRPSQQYVRVYDTTSDIEGTIGVSLDSETILDCAGYIHRVDSRTLRTTIAVCGNGLDRLGDARYLVADFPVGLRTPLRAPVIDSRTAEPQLLKGMRDVLLTGGTPFIAEVFDLRAHRAVALTQVTKVLDPDGVPSGSLVTLRDLRRRVAGAAMEASIVASYRSQVLFAVMMIVIVVVLATLLNDVSIASFVIPLAAYAASSLAVVRVFSSSSPDAAYGGQSIGWSYEAMLVFLTVFGVLYLRVWQVPGSLELVVIILAARLAGLHEWSVAAQGGTVALALFVFLIRSRFQWRDLWVIIVMSVGGVLLWLGVSHFLWSGVDRFNAMWLAPILAMIVVGALLGTKGSRAAWIITLGFLGWSVFLIRQFEVFHVAGTLSGDELSATAFNVPWIAFGLVWLCLLFFISLGSWFNTKGDDGAWRERGQASISLAKG